MTAAPARPRRTTRRAFPIRPGRGGISCRDGAGPSGTLPSAAPPARRDPRLRSGTGTAPAPHGSASCGRAGLGTARCARSGAAPVRCGAVRCRRFAPARFGSPLCGGLGAPPGEWGRRSHSPQEPRTRRGRWARIPRRKEPPARGSRGGGGGGAAGPPRCPPGNRAAPAAPRSRLGAFGSFASFLRHLRNWFRFVWGFFPLLSLLFSPGATVGCGNVWDTLVLQVDSWAGGSALLVWEGCFAVAFPALCVSRILPSLLLSGEAAAVRSDFGALGPSELSPACPGAEAAAPGPISKRGRADFSNTNSSHRLAFGSCERSGGAAQSWIQRTGLNEIVLKDGATREVSGGDLFAARG